VLSASGAAACQRGRSLRAAGFAQLGKGASPGAFSRVAGDTDLCTREHHGTDKVGRAPLVLGAPSCWHADVSSGGRAARRAERRAVRRDAAADAAACEAGATSGRVQEGRQRGRQAAREARAALQGEHDHAVCVSSVYKQCVSANRRRRAVCCVLAHPVSLKRTPPLLTARCACLDRQPQNKLRDYKAREYKVRAPGDSNAPLAKAALKAFHKKQPVAAPRSTVAATPATAGSSAAPSGAGTKNTTTRFGFE
jgi:hypothetical protein